MATSFRFSHYGEAAILVRLGNTIDEAQYHRLMALVARLQASPPAGYRELVPAYNSLLVLFDPLQTAPAAFLAALRKMASARPETSGDGPRQVVELPVHYGGADGPDLAAAANRAGLSPEEFIARHAGRDYLVYMLGFRPGFPYLGGLDPILTTPRLATPRARVPAGSVGIADHQTGVYPAASPGGWNLIGRTPLALFDPTRRPPALLAPGQYLRFVPGAEPVTTTTPLIADWPTTTTSTDWQPPAAGPLAGSGIRVIKPGPLSLIQDAGRPGYLASGVPPSGPLDAWSLALANRLVGNPTGTAGIECTLGGLELYFGQAAQVAVCGAIVPLSLDGHAVAMNRALAIPAGSGLTLGSVSRGLRSYLAVAGGIQTPLLMGSRAAFPGSGFGGLAGRGLQAGDQLPLMPSPSALAEVAGDGSSAAAAELPAASASQLADQITLRVTFLDEQERFTAASQRRFLTEPYRVSSRSDRMGCRLEGPALEHVAGADIISSGVLSGTIQVPGDGQPIVLLADRQTTGGYTRLAQVIEADLPLLGQARPGCLVHFAACTIPGAVAALRATTERLETLRASLATARQPLALVRRFKLQLLGQEYAVTIEELH